MSLPEPQQLPAPHAELVNYIHDHPEKPMMEIMEPYRKYEAELRSVFAQDRKNPALGDPYINLVPLFNENTKNIKTRARSLATESQDEKDRYIMALPDDKRHADGSPAVVSSIKEFRKNFNIFSESSLVDMNWQNVVAAGSSVINTLLPVPPEFNTTKRKLREYYHEKFCPASDVDLFLYGLTHDEAIEKIKEIEAAVRDAILTEVTVVRTKYAITIASQYPTRHIQIVLRVYKSIGEILTGFDIDAAGGAYDGNQVWVTPRALGSFITQVNHIDLSRRSPSYENRLSKYSHRNFEVYWPELDRSRIDPTIFERSFQRTLGLARLLVLEQLPTSTVRETYLNKRREERGRPAANRYVRHQLNGNIKDNYEDEVADWIDEQDVSNYHTFTVPYGQHFHAKKIEKLCYTRDLLLNAEWNQPKEREVYLHRHPAFFGRVEDVILDCCGSCPKPVTPEEIEAAEKEGDIYISGNVSFLIDDPGRQQIGSFNPLTENDWTDMAYVGNTARLCQSIVDGDADSVLDWLSQDGADPNKRDYTGRSPLHLAVISSTSEIVRCLVEHGSRLTARLADGRTALHLAAERGNVDVIKILMEKSIANEEEEEDRKSRRRKEIQAKIGGTSSSQVAALPDDEDMDDEAHNGIESDTEMVDAVPTDVDSMATGSFVKVKDDKESTETELVVEDSTDEPDFYKIDVLAWDVPCSPLHLAISEGHEEAVKALYEFGSDALLPIKFLDSDRQPTAAILTLALALSLPLEKAKSMAVLLLKLGATSAQADLNGCTALHRYVDKGTKGMIDTLWEHDKAGLKAALNHMVMGGGYWNPEAIAPLHTAIENNDSMTVLRLLEAGANPHIDFDTWLKAMKVSKLSHRLQSYDHNVDMYQQNTRQPLILAIKSSDKPELAVTLLEKGADPNTMTSRSYLVIKDEWQRRYYKGETVLDLVRYQLKHLRKYHGEQFSEKKPTLPKGMDDYLRQYDEGTYQHWRVCRSIDIRTSLYRQQQQDYEEKKKKFDATEGFPEKLAAIQDLVSSLEKVEKAIIAKGGKTFEELHPDIKAPEDNGSTSRNSPEADKPDVYEAKIAFRGVTDVTAARDAAYRELFEASWAGDVDKIKSLTLQAWGENQEEPPLQIAVSDDWSNTPLSLAFLRGHHSVAWAILEIVLAQYSPEEKDATRYKLDTGNSDDEDESACESGGDSTDDPKIISEVVDKNFTIDNIGQVPMQVKSVVKPIDFLTQTVCAFKVQDGKASLNTVFETLFGFALHNDDSTGLKTLIDMGTHFAGQKLVDGTETEDVDAAGRFIFPEEDFLSAVNRGKTAALAEIISRTGAGIPLDDLVKKSGIEMKRKPRYYQGLTVYGKKRKDWATAGRNMVVRSTGMKTPPLLHAAKAGNIESVEWFLSDAPHRLYNDFGKSQAAREDPRLKHLNQAPGGFDRAISRWLGIQNELVLHCAVMASPRDDHERLVQYVVQACPNSLEYRSTLGDTPLWLAFCFGRVDVAKALIKAGANQMVRNNAGENIIHAALSKMPKLCRLRPMLELVDSGIVAHLFQQRNNLHENGTTPLHSWIATGPYSWTHPYVNDHQKLEVLELLLSYSQGSELEMLNGAGDTPLHTTVMLGNVPFTKALLDHKPKLLYRENAVGRTPAEVAREKVTSEKLAAPNPVSVRYSEYSDSREPKAMAGREASQFVRRKGDEEGQDDATTSVTKQVWNVMHAFMERYPDKRRLVSLSEANDVAKRLGEKYNASRYFSIQARGDEKDADPEEKEAEREASQDYAARLRVSNSAEAWLFPEEEEKPECECCGKKHA
ncbi:Uncharacterized protein CTRI78_v003421 [Colletotrichum trifolii]|uniref:Ankyrin repeat protein n=1 Tax=Colletotrichum trifolii TaxID=5466 RepID=A0A4V3HWQ8_COLTR|nr:Uncharacterized protein CTRI78_v003421 [Colletotrichum trifolii]